jgi:hypothetical protein
LAADRSASALQLQITIVNILNDTAMHIHPNQITPNTQLEATYAAEKAAAKAAAERTRRKLMESASELAGEAAAEEAYVLEVESQEDPTYSKKRNPPRRDVNRQAAGSLDEDHSVSDWA